MWPVLLDMTKDESVQSLRNLELEAYAHLISALRAQGPLNPDKRKLLKDTSQVLNITQDRHKAEIRRAINDERLNTIAYHVTGLTETLDDWAQEGRRTVPLLPRMAPQTVYSALADETADEAALTNKHLPSPALTERKRALSQPPPIITPDKSASFRIPDLPKTEEAKKRKLPVCTENSTLAQHLLGPPKVSRSQQMIRQRAKMLMKEMGKKPSSPKHPYPMQVPQNGPKFPAAISPPSTEETIEQIQNEINSYTPQKSVEVASSSCTNENQAPPQRPKMITTTSKAPPNTFKPMATPTTTPGPRTNEPQKMVKLCPPRKSIKQQAPLAQKLVMVSNAQTIPNTSILQKTLSIPLVKNLNMKNLEKFKIVTTTSSQLAASVNNLNSFKHKVVTVKTNPKKVIPLSQLLGTKGGIKVLPIGGKIVGKSITTTASQPVYIVNTMGAQQRSPGNVVQTVVQQPQEPVDSHQLKENGKSSVLGDILKASGVTAEDYDSQIEGFRIPNNNVNHITVDGEIQVAGSQIHEEPESPEFDKCSSFVVLGEDVDYVEGDTQANHIMETEDVLCQVVESALGNLSEIGNN